MIVLNPRKRYPKSHANRFSGHDPRVQAQRITFLKLAGTSFLILQLGFIIAFCYIFGALYQTTTHAHNINILFIDYDGSEIGDSVRAAYSELQADTFPNLQEKPASQFPDLRQLKEEVCQANYWAVLYISPNSTSRLKTALSINTTTSYNETNILTYVWNEARYPANSDSLISSNLNLLSQSASHYFSLHNQTGKLTTLLQPWTLTSQNLQPTTQGSRIIYNTLVIVLILVQQFFYLASINGLYLKTGIYTRLYPHRIIIYRNLNSALYTFTGSLCISGVIWAFKLNWDIHAPQFFEMWMILWIFAHLNFLVLDFLTILLPPGLMPIGFLWWIILNVTSVIVPFELSGGFYRLGYFLPANEVWAVLMDVWSKGCYGVGVGRGVGVLSAWEVVGLVVGAWGVYRRCHFAAVEMEEHDGEFKRRVEMEVGKVREKERERQRRGDGVVEIDGGDGGKERTGDSEEDREEAEDIERQIRLDGEELRREETIADRRMGFGPSFSLRLTHSRGA